MIASSIIKNSVFIRFSTVVLEGVFVIRKTFRQQKIKFDDHYSIIFPLWDYLLLFESFKKWSFENVFFIIFETSKSSIPVYN
jgi:hypothetical protein